MLGVDWGGNHSNDFGLFIKSLKSPSEGDAG